MVAQNALRGEGKRITLPFQGIWTSGQVIKYIFFENPFWTNI